MLARLDGLSGVERAATDRAGTLLLLTLRDEGALAPAIDVLRQLGYAAEPARDVPTIERWYDAASVGELSRTEADVIAERVIAKASVRDEAVGGASQLRAAIIDALHACFIATDLDSGPSPGAFRAACVDAVTAALVPIVGGPAARDIGRLVDADMRVVHASGHDA